MAFIRKTGSMLGRSVSNHITQDISFSNPSIFQALRMMSSSKLFIGGLSFGTDEPSLREAFKKYGEVIDARIIVDRESRKSRGFAFVTYASVEEASAAIQALDQQDLHGRRIRVDYANDRTRGYGSGVYRDGNFGGGGYNRGGFGGSYGAGGGYNNNDGFENASEPNASNNGYEHQNVGVASGAAGDEAYSSGGAGGSMANNGYDGFGDKSSNEARVDEGFREGDSTEGNYAERS